jgi:pyruvate dehydrogenase E2 component (dihydrolipoamide acetyltransferase)
MFQFKLPDIGEGVVEGEIVSWKVKVGDDVAEDQPLVEVMTDKATVEIPSPKRGRVVELRGAEGDVVAVGAVIVVLETGATGGTRATPEKAAHGKAASELGPEKAPGKASPEQVTSPPMAHVSAPASPDLGGDTLSIPPVVPSAPVVRGKLLATPATRRTARELGVDLTLVPGTGPQGRVTRSDVVAWKEGRRAPIAAPPPGPIPQGTGLPFVHVPVPTGSGPEERIKVRGLRRKIAESMVRSAMSIPHFSYVDEVDMTELVRMRQQINDDLVARGRSEERVSYLPFIMKALQIAFRDHPEVNALYDATTEEIVLKRYFHCGLATDSPQGLYVSVIRDVEHKTLLQLGRDLKEVVGRVRAGKATREDLSDSTFTITSIGNIGGLFATPIINYPEVAILGVNKIVERPVVRGGAVVIRHMTHLSPSFDHRVVDGANAARFTSRLKELLENPGLILAAL